MIIHDAVYCRTSNVFRYKLSHVLFFILFLIVFYPMIVVTILRINYYLYRYMYMAAPDSY